MSSSTPLSSLRPTTIPLNNIDMSDGIPLSQFNYLIDLIAIPIDVITNQINDKIETKRVKHRVTERIRHKKIIELISQLSEVVGSRDQHQTQSNVLTRAARYALFLSYITEKLEKDFNNKDQISCEDWLSELHQKAYEQVSLITQDNVNSRLNYSERKRVIPQTDEVLEQQTPPKEYSDHQKRETLLKTPDHCLPLKKRAKMIMFSDFQD